MCALSHRVCNSRCDALPAGDTHAILGHWNPTIAGRAMDTSQMLSIDQARQLLRRVGVELPQDAPPEAVFRGLDVLLQGVPDRVVAAAAVPGAEVRFGAQAGITLPPLSPVNYSYNLAIEGRVGLSEVQTGPGLQPSQTFRASVQLQQDDRAALERTLINRLYKLSGYTDQLPQGARDVLQGPIQQARERIDNNPLLRAFVRGVPVSVVHTESEGSRLSYEAVVPPEIGRRLDANDRSALPNPLDPLNMPAGSSVLIRGQNLRGSSTEVGYRFGIAGVAETRLEGQGFGVRRLQGSMVEVYSGPISTVEASVYLGLGGASLRIEAENTLEERRLSAARIDLATPEGQAAYRQFMASGRVPDAVAPGVPQAGYSTELSIEQARRFGLYLGSASLAFDNSVEQQVTVGNLGSREEMRFSYSREGQVATESVYPMGADGRPDFGAGNYRMVLPGLSAEQAGGLRAAFGGYAGGHRGLGERQAVELGFDAPQLMALRERSREFLASRPGGSELLAHIDAGRPLGIEQTDPLVRIAGARDAQQVFGALQEQPQRVPDALHRLNVGVDPAQRRPVPGTLEIQPPAEMQARLAGRSEAERTATLERYYRAPPADARQPSAEMRAPAADPTAAANVHASGPSLTDRSHPDHELFVALRGRFPTHASDEQVAVATLRARQAEITVDRLAQVAADRNDPNQVWVVGRFPGLRAQIDLSQPAPPLTQTSAELLASAQTRDLAQPQPAMQR
jgi:hypothetical protein